MQLSRGPRIPRPIPWASLRRTAAFRSLATRRCAATGDNPNCARKLRVAASRTACGRKGTRGMTTWSTSPGRLTPDQAAGVNSTARRSARNASRQLPSRAPRTWTTGLDTRFASSSTSA